MTIKRINPDGLLSWPQMAQVAVADAQRLVFIAGQTATAKDFTHLGGSDLGAQTCAAFENLRIALDAAGASPENVVSSTVYIVGLTEEKAGVFAAAMNKALDGKPFPPHPLTMIGVASLAGAESLVEISAVAVL